VGAAEGAVTMTTMVVEAGRILGLRPASTIEHIVGLMKKMVREGSRILMILMTLISKRWAGSKHHDYEGSREEEEYGSTKTTI